MDIKRVIVSRTDKIGDLILSIPSFFMIKKMNAPIGRKPLSHKGFEWNGVIQQGSFLHMAKERNNLRR